MTGMFQRLASTLESSLSWLGAARLRLDSHSHTGSTPAPAAAILPFAPLLTCDPEPDRSSCRFASTSGTWPVGQSTTRLVRTHLLRALGPLARDTSELIWLCEVRREFYSDAQGCLLVFDVCAQAAGGPPSAGPSKGLEIRTAHSSSGVL